MSMFSKNRAPRRGVPNAGSKVAAVALSVLMLWQSFGAYTPAYAITAGGGSSEAQPEVTVVPQNEETTKSEVMPTSDAQGEEASRNEATVDNGVVSDGDETDADAAANSDDQSAVNAVSDDPSPVASANLTVTVGQTITIVGTKGSDHYWQTFVTNIATAEGTSEIATVTGVKVGNTVVRHFYYDELGHLTSEAFDLTVESGDASVYYLIDPTKDANSNDTGNWGGPLDGVATVNTDGATWVDDKNCFDNLDQRVISWPNGTNVIAKGSNAWKEIFNNYRSTIQEQLPGIDFTEDDVEEISLVPAKISKNNGEKPGTPDKHLDCNVSIKCKSVALAKYYVRDAGSSLLTFVGSKNYRTGEKTQPSDVTTEAFPETKVVDGVTYTFSGWYLDADFTTPVTFPYTLNSSQTFYAKYTSDAMTVSGTNYEGVYDGEEHGTAAAASVTEDTKVEYSTDGEATWSTEVPTVKDVAEVTVKVRATNPNYTTATCEYTLKVTPAKVTVTANSKSKKYDGIALTDNGYSITSGSFVAGEGFESVTVEGSQTYVGSSENKITGHKVNANTKEGNYKFTFLAGTLTVIDGSGTDPVDPEKKSEEKKAADNSSSNKKSATPKTGDALLANQAIAAIAGTGALGVAAAAVRRKRNRK